MQKPSEHHKLTSGNNIIKFKKPVHDPFKDKTCYQSKKNVSIKELRTNTGLFI